MDAIEITDTLVDELMEDWLERDGETFVHIRKKGRLGWEKTLEAEDSYSSYLSDSITQEELIKRAYSIAKDMIVVMDPPFKVYIRISNHGGHGSTDGKYVYVSTKVFDEPELSVGEKFDTFLGLVIHEGCHLLYTDLSWLHKFTFEAVRSLWNIIEDERIERLCGDLKPGLANFLEKTKYYVFDHEYLDTTAGMEDELPPYEKLVSCFFKIIRYPRYLREEDVVEFAPYLKKIKEVALPYPDTTEQAVKLAYKVYEIIKELYIDKEREKSEEDGDGRSDDEITAEALRKFAEDAEKTSEKFKAVSETPSESAPSGGGRLKEDEMAKAVSAKHGLLGEECEGLVETGGSRDTFFSRADSDQRRYLESLDRVKRYIPAIAKIMKGHCREYKLIHRSMRSGVLDTNKLVEAVQGVPAVYIREGAVHTDKIAVGVLIDESGSMSGLRIQAARDAAILINEALCSMPNVELFIYGHSGDMRYSMATEMSVYREKGFAPKYALGAVDAKCENRDGVAIIEVAKRIRKQTKNPVILFVLSDGAPAAYGYGGSTAMAHVRSCVQQAENLGFSVIQVCINHCYDPSKMFKNFVILEDMSTLAFELSKAIKKTAMTLAKVHIS